MFAIEDTFGYENNIFEKMKYIDQESRKYSSHYINNLPLNQGEELNSRSFSLYGKKIAKQVNNLNKIHSEIVNEIRDVGKRIKELASSGKATKTEVDLRTSKYGLYKTLIDLSKTVADLEGKIEKGRMDDIKFIKDIELARVKLMSGGVGNGTLELESGKISTNDNYMNNIFSNGIDNFLNVNSSVPTSLVTRELPQPQIKEENTIVIENKLSDEVDKSFIDNIDFKEKKLTDAELALRNIKIRQNPNMKEFFKYNKDLEIGWLTWMDVETNEEALGTHHDIRLLYPIEIDSTNNLANTRLNTSYPIIYTDEEPSQEIKSKYEMMRKIEENKRIKELMDKKEREEENEF